MAQISTKKSIVLLHFGTSGERRPGVKVSPVMKRIERSEHGSVVTINAEQWVIPLVFFTACLVMISVANK